MFELNQQSSEHYTVDVGDNTIGEVYREVDGFYVFAFTDEPHLGCFPTYFFKFVYDSLCKLNLEWQRECENI